MADRKKTHNIIRPVNRLILEGKYKIVFSTPQTKNTNIPVEFQGLQIFKNKHEAKKALKKRKNLTKILNKKRAQGMKGNKRLVGNVGGDPSNLKQNDPDVQRLRIAKSKRAQELFSDGYKKSEILRIIIKEFKLKRNINSRSWPKWLTEIN
jgi:hypothetical protein